MGPISESFAKTIALLEEEKLDEAKQEYRVGVAAPVRKVYSEVASATPRRFARLSSDDWSAWARQFYIRMRKAEDALSAGQAEDAAKKLVALRDHFFTLHDKTVTLKSNDYIYAFFKKAGVEQPAAAELNGTVDSLTASPPSLKAKAQAEAYVKAFEVWTQAVEPALRDGKLEPDELEALRKATGKFYREYGVQFE